jgi:hypothetical protein
MTLRAYNEQRNNAAARGISFAFTYDAWVAWWRAALGDDWMEKRGRTKGKYCMARLGDDGPYAPENVMCILHGKNVTDAATNGTIAFGENAGHAVLTALAAQSIYTSSDPYQVLADRYGVNIQTISDIRGRRTWRRATEGLTRTNTWGRNQWT